MCLARLSHLTSAAHGEGDGDCRKPVFLWEGGGSRNGWGRLRGRRGRLLATLYPWFHIHNQYSEMTPGLSEDADELSTCLQRTVLLQWCELSEMQAICMKIQYFELLDSKHRDVIVRYIL